MLNPETHADDNEVLRVQARTDSLIQTITEQITLHTFDTDNEELIRQMVEGFADSRGRIRLRIAEILGEIGEPITPILTEALANHSNPIVRRACAKTLTLIADPNAIPTLVYAFLNDEDTVVQGSSVGALARTGESAVPELLKILESSEHTESIKGHAAWALAFIGAEAKEHLYQALSSDSEEVRAAVVAAMAKVAQEDPKARALDILINALGDSSGTVRSEASAALGNLACLQAVPALIELLKHQEAESRKSAALSLMKIRDFSVIGSIQLAFSREEEMSVKSVMQLAISQLEKEKQLGLKKDNLA
ncbi:Bilin biosynthesis protein MpeU [Richelia intracellularis HH01]|uniref:Bilin biosynthesis protein MpeU n=1 Tax=Richelia intracellularis HH01 TaxID=1165094 RepID=M1X4T2_9NOST|nr:HEAT repeat domain-containing protein [Richelia intracellularis]CCH66636.1 Bilin biosynthesis protein MpeU [Richelia intracellularis HH01]HAE06340.1 HEAT repeat domain-containing protein [Richelia sp.]